MSRPASVNIQQTAIITEQGTLRAIKLEIRERRQYRNTQEKIINDLIETGNSRLMELNHDIELAKKELRELKTDIRKAAQDKVLLMRDIDDLSREADRLARQTGLVNIYP